MPQEDVSGTERAVFGLGSSAEVAQLVDAYLRRDCGTGLDGVLFRAGRIDAVWAVRTTDGRSLVVRAHRAPADVPARRTARVAQEWLVAAGFGCPAPVAGPGEVGGVVMSAETLLTAGSAADGRDPVVRRAMAAGLRRHVELLREAPIATDDVGGGPAWCRYQDGPWPTPHDSIFDFTVTPYGAGWLDDYAQEASAQLRASGGGLPTVVGHADWYAGNLRFDGGELVGAFDWDLVADSEAAIAGMSAACFAASSTAGGGLSDPDETRVFLQDYESARGTAFDADEQRTAAGAAAWVMAYNARCERSFMDESTDPGSGLRLAQDRGQEYLDLRW